MDEGNREAFNQACTRLMLALDARAVTQERLDAYWEALHGMSLFLFERVVSDALSPEGESWHHGRLPNTSQLWARWRVLKGQQRPAGSGQSASQAPQWDPWLERANLMLLREIRRLVFLQPGLMGTPGSRRMQQCVARLLEARTLWVSEIRRREGDQPPQKVSEQQRALWRELMDAARAAFPLEELVA